MESLLEMRLQEESSRSCRPCWLLTVVGQLRTAVPTKTAHPAVSLNVFWSRKRLRESFMNLGRYSSTSTLPRAS